MNRIIITILVIGTLFFLLTVIETYGIPMIISDQIVGVYIGGGSIDMDPDLSPSYALDFQYSFLFHAIMPIVRLSLVIAAVFLVPHFILKRKNIPSRPYLLLILAGLLLFFSIPTLVSILLAVIPYYISQPEQFRYFTIEKMITSFWFPIILLTPASIILYKSPIIRRLLNR